MNDKQTLLDMFKRANIKAEECAPNPISATRPFGVQGRDGIATSGIEVESGYSGFITYFTFDAEGSLLTMGAYE